MSKENSAGLGVYNNYGTRETNEARDGVINTAGKVWQKQINFHGNDYTQVSFTLPAGATFLRASAKVTEAFALGGTSPTINVGTSGSHGTNYAIELSEAQAEAVGTYYNATGAGTFAAPLAAATTVVVGLDGTSPTVTSAGAVQVLIEYMLNN